ncbi:Lipid A export ATP-binding/permease protein MsbA [Marinomonas spartinae]|nr:Lipid A export ATP-binding/permease protein MsbA [Marinomonas spartinae]
MTVYDNVAFGDVNRMHEKETVSDCIDRAHASDIVSRLRFQENTQLGYWFDDGVSLSGGQWQRLALARAYMKVDADIFIFDEPTSAIDPVAEAEVYNSLLCYTLNKSVVFITHRYALARTAETIILLDEGKIAEQGSHDALMSEQGRYYNVFKQQAKNFAETLPATVTT